LRNLLSPSAAIEPGYRLFRVETRQGVLKEGFLVKQDAEAVILRRQGSEDERIPQAAISRAAFTRRSVMPDGLLEGLPDAEVVDLFAYLRGLR